MPLRTNEALARSAEAEMRAPMLTGPAGIWALGAGMSPPRIGLRATACGLGDGDAKTAAGGDAIGVGAGAESVGGTSDPRPLGASPGRSGGAPSSGRSIGRAHDSVSARPSSAPQTERGAIRDGPIIQPESSERPIVYVPGRRKANFVRRCLALAGRFVASL